MIRPLNTSARIGTSTMPNGSRRMCGRGFRVICPPSAAVSSPPSFAARAWEASWQVVENRKTTYQTKLNAIISGVKLGISRSRKTVSFLKSRGSVPRMQGGAGKSRQSLSGPGFTAKGAASARKRLPGVSRSALFQLDLPQQDDLRRIRQGQRHFDSFGQKLPARDGPVAFGVIAEFQPVGMPGEHSARMNAKGGGLESRSAKDVDRARRRGGVKIFNRVPALPVRAAGKVIEIRGTDQGPEHLFVKLQFRLGRRALFVRPVMRILHQGEPPHHAAAQHVQEVLPSRRRPFFHI